MCVDFQLQKLQLKYANCFVRARNRLGAFFSLLPPSVCRENLVVTIGSPFIDTIASVDETFLLHHDLLPNNAIPAAERHEDLFSQLQALSSKELVGGSITNTARTMQKLLGTPRAVTFMGAIGKDMNGEAIKGQLREEGLNFVAEEVEGKPTGRCAVLLNEGSRSLVTDLGASGDFSLGFFLKQDVQELVSGAQYFYLSVSTENPKSFVLL